MESYALEWERLHDQFCAQDESWSIVVEGLDLELWQRYYRFLGKSAARLELEVDGSEIGLPHQLDQELFAPHHRTLLTIDLADLRLTTELASPAEMCITIPPGAIDTAAHFRLILRILTTLGRRLHRPTTLRHGKHGAVMLRYNHGEGITQEAMSA